MNWEQIVKANEAIRTTNIRGKDYAEVNQRVKAFRMVFPTGLIDTEMTVHDNGLCVFRATVGYYEADGRFIKLATGTAYEKENSSQINRTSYIENCETSAVGRALGMAGFGIDTSIASAEELQNALLQQGEPVTVQKTAQPSAKPVQKTELPQYDILSETPDDAELRIKWLQKYGEKGMEAACMKKFGTGFAQTPIDKIKAVMPQE